MNFMGMGIPELGVILLVAFLVLGPHRAVNTARNVGKVLGDLRRSFSDVTNAMTVESMEKQTSVRKIDSETPPGVPMRADPPSDETVDEPDLLADDSVNSKDKGGDPGNRPYCNTWANSVAVFLYV